MCYFAVSGSTKWWIVTVQKYEFLDTLAGVRVKTFGQMLVVGYWKETRQEIDLVHYFVVARYQIMIRKDTL